MPVGDVIAVRFESALAPQIGENIRHYRVDAVTPPEATLAQIASLMSTVFAPKYVPMLTTAARFVGAGARRVAPLPLTIEAFDTTNAGPGTAPGDPLPTQTAGIITLRTALAGRRFRGRLYVPFPAEGDNTSAHVPSVGYVTLLDGLKIELLLPRIVANGAGSSTLVPIIFSKRFNLQTPITVGVSRGVWATQRRRGAYGRPNVPTA